MRTPQTEQKHKDSKDLDLRSNQEILSLLAAGQSEAALSVQAALPEIGSAAECLAQSFSQNGRLIYAAAGSSALMALADALELPGTFGINPERIVVLFAGGAAMLRHLTGGPEDNAEAGRIEAQALHLTPNDCMIAITASGKTPYALAAAKVARAQGARLIGITNNENTPLSALAESTIVLPTPPELLAGSTRMGAGTAQKITLNMISTLAALRLGHVHDGFMVNVIADNEKLIGRAQMIISSITAVDEAQARAALTEAGGSVKLAILLAAGAGSLENAQSLLAAHSGHIRPALHAISAI